MSSDHTWVLTDVNRNLWIDEFYISSVDIGDSSEPLWSITKRTLQGGRRDGIDHIEVNNGELSFNVLPTRGMGLWRGQYHDVRLGWDAPLRGPIHPKYVQLGDRGGLGWLSGFDEWMCRCGLGFNGPPGEDKHTEGGTTIRQEPITLHGRIANLPANYVRVEIDPNTPHDISITGSVEEGGLFGGRLCLTTTYSTTPGSNRLTIIDEVENLGGLPAELELLYHCNLGPPLLEAGSRVVVPIKEMSPLTPRAAEGIETYAVYEGPQPGFAEQVYCYKLHGDDEGKTVVLLHNLALDKAIALRHSVNELPCFTVWKNTGALEDGYVTGLEPALNYPNFKSFEREQGRVRVLRPGERYRATWSLEVYDTTEKINGVKAEIEKLQSRANPVIHKSPTKGFSALA
ncbi:MAG: aldose 1-epimerase family protein [Gemmataceae bacterium]